ncbi:hypothetical protein ALC62_06784 [Cyphomyrmex costatus]|uniref:Uncharacterized protein n=1 Tax=Cyphomyrmex costatus TaxID=456900 RepID=A0A195CQL5_9HYME|nr:hypothetical protein ALC62_06784 [Cyphomyrmex costatus]
MLPTQQESPTSSSEVSIKFGSYLVNENSPTPYSDATRKTGCVDSKVVKRFPRSFIARSMNERRPCGCTRWNVEVDDRGQWLVQGLRFELKFDAAPRRRFLPTSTAASVPRIVDGRLVRKNVREVSCANLSLPENSVAEVTDTQISEAARIGYREIVRSCLIGQKGIDPIALNIARSITVPGSLAV